jgi:dissimilatory sulfite reductase (desulfoviridin) alpha/beta subunit
MISQEGYTILVGGKLGRRAQLATTVAELVDESTAMQTLRACIEMLKEEGRAGERFGAVLNRVGTQRLHDRLEIDAKSR